MMTLFQRLDRLNDLLHMDIFTDAPEHADHVTDVRELVGSIREAMDLLPAESPKVEGPSHECEWITTGDWFHPIQCKTCGRHPEDWPR